jgi:hypothetical protein
MPQDKHVCIYGQECWCGANVEVGRLSDGRRVHVAGVTGKAGWPRESDALGVHPSQVEEAHAEAAALGVPTEFTKNGSAVVRDQQHQRRLGKALRMHERNCFNW